jgi:predicted transcriptional regulator
VYFTSLEAARNLLTPRRLALLRAIRKKKPRSIYELAKIVGRNLKNAQTDLQLLERYGLVTLTEGRSRANRRIRIPKVSSDEISLKIAI